MRLGLVAYLTCVFGTADASPLQLTRADNDDFVAQVHGTPDLRLDEIALEIDGERLVTPWKIGPWSRYGEPVAVTLLVQGTEPWIGNDKLGLVHTDEEYPGALPELAVELDRLNFHVLPPRSRMAIATYADRLTYRDPENIYGAALGTQRDYVGNGGPELSEAIERAARDMYGKQPRVARHVIVVLGDGCDDADDDRRKALARWLDGYHIELHAIVYKSRWSCGRIPVRDLTTNVTHVTSLQNLAAGAHRIISSLDDRTYAQFDAAKLPWDGETHSYVVLAGEHRFGPVFRALPDRRERGRSFGWWLISNAGLLALIALPLVIRRWYRNAAASLR